MDVVFEETGLVIVEFVIIVVLNAGDVSNGLVVV